MNHAKTAEPIDMTFGVMTHVGPMNHWWFISST